MSRDTLLQQQKDKDEAFKELSQKYKDPPTLKYEIVSDTGAIAGSIEYNPKGDHVYIKIGGTAANIEGNVLKSLRDTLNKLLED
jgi:hypothetical protein